MCFSQQCTAEALSNGAGTPADHEPCLGKPPSWPPSLSVRPLRFPQPTWRALVLTDACFLLTSHPPFSMPPPPSIGKWKVASH